MSEFKKNPRTLLYDKVVNCEGANIRFVQKKSKKLGMCVTFFNGKNAESYYDNGVFKENSHGIAHFLEHLLFTNVTDGVNWLEKLSSEKVSMNGATGENVVFYHILANAEDMFEKRIEQLMKISFTLDIDDEIFNKEKGIVSSEASLFIDDTRTLANDVISSYYCPSHSKHSIAGTAETVNGIEMDELVKYYQDVYSLDNCEIQVFADFENNPSFESRYLELFAKVIKKIRSEYPIHVQNKGVKRKIAEPINTKFDKKEHTITSAKVSAEEYLRVLKVNSTSEDGFGIKLLSYGILAPLLSPSYNIKVKELLESKGLNVQSDSMGASLGVDSVHEFCMTFKSTTKEKLELLFKTYVEIFSNVRDYIDEDRIQKLADMEYVSEYRKADVSIAYLYTNYAQMAMGTLGKLGYGASEKVESSLYSNLDMFEEIAKEMDFENYIDIHSVKQ